MEGERGGGGERKAVEMRREKKEGLKIGFWNVAGVKGKDEEFWGKIKEWDVIGMMETWIEEKDWEKWEGKVPKEYKWTIQGAVKEGKKGRAKGGIWLGIRKGLEGEGEGWEEEGLIVREVKWNKETWKVGAVYIKDNVRRIMGRIKGKAEERRGETGWIVGGDFNARTGERGALEDGEEGRERKSKDKVINKQGEELIKWVEEEGWGIMNGAKEGDREGEVTFTGGRGETVIDYAIGDRAAWERIEKLMIGDEIDSDHQSVTVWVGGTERREGKMREKRGEEWIEWMDWSEEAREEFREKTEEWVMAEGGIEEELEDLIRKIRETVKWKRRKKGKEKINKWWNEECREKKREVGGLLRKWKRGKGSKEDYIKGKRDYKELCERRKEEEREELLREAKEAKTQEQVWKVINRERKRRVRINEQIKMEEWEEYFRTMLSGLEKKDDGRERRGRERDRGKEGGMKEGEEEELREGEIRKAIGGLKRGKAAGEDGLPNEVWIEGGKGLKEAVGNVCKRVWRGEGFPERWREGIIVPIAKKRGAKEVSDHRGVTLMATAYKIYATVLANRLEKEIEEKGIIPEWQAGFRKKRGVIDNIYTLNYLVGREIERGRRVVAALVDLKAAFDTVDRRILGKRMEEEGVSKRLRERIEEIYKETGCRVRVGENYGRRFWTERGVRQGCPLSPILFNILIADLEKELGEEGVGGIKLGGERLRVLGYADDIIIMTEEEEGMRWLLRKLERYLDRKGLMLNVEKTKIIKFGKGRRGGRKGKWWWKGREIEEVKEVVYLGYKIRRNGNQEAQVEERVKKAMGVMGQVWSIGKRKFGGDWNKRIKMFDWLVGSVIGFGAEIWGWREWEKVERLQERYIRWILGVEGRTPGYMVREEGKRDKMRTRMGRRAIAYEEKLERGEGTLWARRCWEEIKERGNRRGSVWEEQRKSFYEERGVSVEWVRGQRERGVEVREVVEQRDKEIQQQERFERIQRSRWNRWYKEIRTLGMPRYLKEKWKEERMIRVARFRLGNEMREGKYWEEEEKRRCRICGWEEETWEHVVEICMREGDEGGREKILRILDDSGNGEKWMRKLQERRNGVSEGGGGREREDTG